MHYESAPTVHSVPEAARRLGIGTSTLWRMIANGEVAVVRLARRRTVITDDAIRDLLQRNTSPARAA